MNKTKKIRYLKKLEIIIS